MNLCILVPAADVEKVRDAALTVPTFATTARDKLMNIALSESGDEPATHYFCAANVTQEIYDKLIGMRKYSEMSKEDPATFLKSKKLKVITKK